MTADTDVRKVEIEDKCGLDMSSYQDLPPTDCNGSAKLANIGAGGDPDGSYVFVDDGKADSVVVSPVDVVDSSGKSCLIGNGVEICVEENGGNVECCVVESECIVVGDESNGDGVAVDAARACDDVAEAGEVNECAVEDEVIEPVGADGEVKDEKVVELDLSPKALESEAYQGSVVEVEEVREPVVVASGVGGAMTKSKEESNFVLNAELGESQMDEKNVILEADGGELPEVEEVKSEKQQMQSVGHVDATVESHAASGDFVEFGEVKREVENKIDTDVGVDQNQESQFVVTAEVQSDLEQMQSVGHVEESVESHSTSGDFVESGEEKRKVENKIGTDVGVDQNQESQFVVTAEVQSDLKQENEVADFPNKTETPMETEAAGGSLLTEDQVLQTEQVDRCIPEDAQVSSANCSMPEMEDIGKRVDESQHDIQLNESSEVSQSLFAVDCVGPESENEREATSETESAGYPTPSENQVSQIGDVGKCTDKSQEGIQFEESPEDTKTLLSTVSMKSETELPEEPKTASKPVSSENEALESEDANGCTDESCKDTQLNGGPENAQILLSSDCVRSETMNGDMAVENDGNVQPDTADGKILDKEVENGDSLITENVPTSSTDDIGHVSEVEKLDGKNCEDDICGAPKDAKCLSSGTGIEFGSIGPCEKAPMLWCDDVELEVSNGDIEPINGLAPGYHVNDSQHNGSLPDVKSKCEAEHSSDISSRNLPSNGVVVTDSEILDGKVVASGAVDESVGGSESVHVKFAHSERDVYEQDGEGVSDDKATSPGKECIDGVQSDPMPTSLPESSVSDSTAGQDADTEVITRPFNFLIRIPRFEDEKLGEEIRHVQLQLEEKTRLRDTIQVEIQTKRANCRAHHERFEAAKLEERAARRLVKQKRQEIDSLQSVINRGKNAVSVNEIDNRIYGMEHMIQHETLDLKDEKYLIREIHKLKHLREQLSSNMGSQDEVQLALDQKDQNEESLKILKKELESLKDTVLKAEAIKIAAGKKYDDETKRLSELQAQVKAAHGVRQETYEHLSILRQKMSEKHKNFRLYKNDAAAAGDFAYRGDKVALHHLCVDQVETLMELWNTDDEFRNEYVRCNMRSTIRRLKTLDGRSLGPDEEPPVLPSYVDERVPRRMVSTPGQAKTISVGTVEPEKQVSSIEAKQAGDKSAKKVADEKNQTAKTQDTAKTILITGSATVSGKDESLEDRKDEEEMQTKEEQELARKAEELRKAEVADKLKEQRRLEEKAKAIEALERKKRNAEKVQMRAELRAQKEAEQKEKEKEKRLRKKGKKKNPGDAHDGNSNEDDTPTSEIMTEAISKEPEAGKESNITATIKRPQRPSNYFVKQSKPKAMPPPLRNRGKRRMQQWMWMICPIVLVLGLFLLGNTGFFLNLRQQKAAGTGTF